MTTINNKIIKYILAVPYYIFLLLAGFIGGPDGRDKWDDVKAWIDKKEVK